jgi:hypothetical protein
MVNYSLDNDLNDGAIAGIIIGCLDFIVIVWVVWTSIRDCCYQQMGMSGIRKPRDVTCVPNDDPDVAQNESREREDGRMGKHQDRSEEYIVSVICALGISWTFVGIMQLYSMHSSKST